MKQVFKILLVAIFIVIGCRKTDAQSFELQQLILDMEKLTQLKDIYSDVVKGYEILSKGYQAVSDISKGNFDLHQLFLDGLLKASPVVQNYTKVADIISCQLQVVSEYELAFTRFKADNNFSPDEILYLSKVYNNLIDESIKGLSDLTSILTDGIFRASDDERLDEIDRLDNEMQERLSFLRYFNNNTTILSLQRSRERNDAGTLKNIYGIKD